MYADLCNFLLVVQEGTFTAAARRAHLTQPALSASIQRLEAQLEGEVFIRDRKGAILTDAGRALLPHARAARAAVEEGRSAVREVLGLGRGSVTVGAGATACTYLLPPVLAGFQQDHPAIRYRLREVPSAQVRQAVRDGSIDLGIATRLPGDPQRTGLTEQHWRADPLVLIQAPGESRRTPPHLSFVEGSPLRRLLQTHFPDADVVMELASIPAVKGHVMAGLGIALVPKSAVLFSLSEGRLEIRPDARTPLHRDLVLLHRGEDRLSVAADALRQRILTAPDAVLG